MYKDVQRFDYHVLLVVHTRAETFLSLITASIRRVIGLLEGSNPFASVSVLSAGRARTMYRHRCCNGGWPLAVYK